VSQARAGLTQPRTSAPALPRPRRVRITRALGRGSSVAFVSFVGALLYGPVILLAVFSFNNSISVSLPLRGFTTKWYSQILDDPVMRTSIKNSLLVAGIVTPICLVLGTLSAFALTRMRFRLRSGTGLLVAAPLVVPWLVIGISALLFFNRASLPIVGKMPLSLTTVTIMQIVCTFPLVTAIVAARLARFDQTQEEAAIDLGASQIEMLRYVVLPHLYSALAASAIFAFSWSFNNFEISYFVGGFDQTFPVWVYSTLRHAQALPGVNAISTIISVFQVLLICLAWRILRPRGNAVDEIIPFGGVTS
jgi:spermidine/putrescine transport system permease protein